MIPIKTGEQPPATLRRFRYASPARLRRSVGTKKMGRSMGLFDIFKPKTSDNTPRIRNEKELKVFLMGTIKDERLCNFLMEVINQIGRDGYLEVEQGGNGRPYSAEYQKCPEDPRKTVEIHTECRSLKQAFEFAQTDADRDRIDRQIAELAGGCCIIRLNLMTSDEFNRQKTLIINTWSKLKEIMRKME
jgi:hypothetical protein